MVERRAESRRDEVGGGMGPDGELEESSALQQARRVGVGEEEGRHGGASLPHHPPRPSPLQQQVLVCIVLQAAEERAGKLPCRAAGG